MAKRPAEAEDGNQAYLKRQKISNPGKLSAPAEEIRSGKQLRQTLAFDQDSGRSKQAIRSFKVLLEGFSTTESDNAGRIRILKEYLESQKPVDDEDKTAIYLSDVMQTWSFASQSNDESLLSAVPAVLALLLRTLSNILELSDYGLRLGRTLLQKRQQELIARGITANKTKEFVISPALRLLRELATFDGGVLAKQVFRARDQVFKNLSRNLNLRFTGDAVETRKKPSVRSNAVRFVLTCIKFLPTEAKRELLNQRDIVAALTKDLKDDPPFIVREILETLKLYVLQDEALPRDAKTKLVNATSLGRVAMLYRYDQPDEDVSAKTKSVDTVAHELLLLACTSHDVGVLNRQTGFYPRGLDPNDTHDFNAEQDFIDLGLDSIEWIDKFREKIPVRNTILSDFIQNLRPWSSAKQTELLLAILKAAPELTADYFLGKKSFLFDPKLTATWIGYSAFLFSTLQLPIPRHFGHQGKYPRLPPPTSIVLESLLPQPLSQKVLTRCLNQPYSLITFFAVRLLCMSLGKLHDILRMYHEAASGESSVWAQAAERLTYEYCQRCPSIKDVIGAFRNIPAKDLLQKEATTKLLVLYYEIIPRVALDAKFDVAATLIQALKEAEELDLIPEDRAMRALELENLTKFASFSPGMRWFSKVEGLKHSPFIALLKLSAESPVDIPMMKLRSVLELITRENQIFQSHTPQSALDSFIFHLRNLKGSVATELIYRFIDDCVSRVAFKSVKYLLILEEIEATLGSDGGSSIVSLLTLAILEQWPFIIKTVDSFTLQLFAEFLAHYLAASIKIKEDERIIGFVTRKLADEVPQDSPSRKIIERFKEVDDAVSVPETTASTVTLPEKVSKSNAPSESEKLHTLAIMLDLSQPRSEDHSSLVKWMSKEVDEVIDGGYAAALIMLLSSEHLSVRKEAATNIMKFAAKLKDSTFEEKEQIWLLLSEVVETARKTIDADALPTVIASFASHAVAVLNDPLHCLYPKINKFLSQGPTWELDKIPLMYKIMDDAPSLDDAYYLEIAWLLNYMLNGLRTATDMAIYRKRRVFEKFLSLYNNPYLAPGLRDKILKILFSATTVEGGSTTLITRFSTMTWLQAQVALGGGVPLKVLMEEILESCDRRRVDKWSNGGANDAKVDTLKF
ncbi:URB1 ribosome biogenesis 1 [Hyphodiscus hymeniophilus]|uniref:URB1 ribosome biogenesis 1 n=1 Tax=Hyphodiscus hymeniophilus TaxID=353542 RepID=A0A9P7B095_9HELO|nr:URB1 ribosome biogenesis 1 [Hyphodiscus hymeniophilus]